MDKISVIVPVYNVEQYIEKCLISILSQTYKNLEIICVNDGSTDASGRICDDFAKKDHRIIVYHTENRGVSAARNKGLENFTGDYVGFVDSDDWIEPEMYEELLNLLKSKGADIASCGFFFDNAEGPVPAKNILSVPTEAVETRRFLEYIYRRDMYKGVSGYLVTRLFKSFLFKAFDNGGHHIRFCEELNIGEDVLLLAASMLKAKTAAFMELPLYHYYQNPSSSMHSLEKRLESVSSLEAYKRVIELFEDNNINTDIIDLVKRFYVYHASLLVPPALKSGNKEKLDLLHNEIRRYLDVYEKTNSEFPERIENIRILLRSLEEEQCLIN
jgi:glycosyltransferase involved in cell wall biosynthesis